MLVKSTFTLFEILSTSCFHSNPSTFSCYLLETFFLPFLLYCLLDSGSCWIYILLRTILLFLKSCQCPPFAFELALQCGGNPISRPRTKLALMAEAICSLLPDYIHLGTGEYTFLRLQRLLEPNISAAVTGNIASSFSYNDATPTCIYIDCIALM